MVEIPEITRKVAQFNKKLTRGCWKCGEEGHLGRDFTKTDNTVQASIQTGNIQTSNIGEKRLRQGELPHPPTKRALTGELRVTVLDSDNDDEDLENLEAEADLRTDTDLKTEEEEVQVGKV